MKKCVSILLAVLLAATAGVSLAETVKIGATPVPHVEILEFISPMMEEKGFELDIVAFEDYIMPNTLVENGELDANYFQHINYLNNFNTENGTHLVAVIPVHFEPMGVYKGKTQTLEELPDGATIGVPNDPTNEARALQLLETLGLIELNPDAGITATKLDITKNDKNLEIVEMESAQLPRRLEEFDLAVINGNNALNAGLYVNIDAVGGESSDVEVYKGNVNYVAVKEDNAEAPFVEALREALNDQTTIDFINEKYQGNVIVALDAEMPEAEAE